MSMELIVLASLCLLAGAVALTWLRSRLLSARRRLGELQRALQAAEGRLSLQAQHQQAQQMELERVRNAAEQAARAAAADYALQVQERDRKLRELDRQRQAEAQEHQRQQVRAKELAQQLARQAEQREKESSERERQRRQLSSEFEWQVAAILEQVQVAVRELRGSATHMAQLAADSARRSNDAADMARRTDETASQAARGASALSEAALRMRGQAEASRAGAEAAVVQAAEAASAIRGLFDATREIGSIAGIISEITRQTTLLSINARIEAARAGEAGRGFAVVASEVMELAARTRKATDSIEQQISQVTDAAQLSADVLARLGQCIGDLGNAAGSIYATAESQCRSTIDISGRMGVINQSTRSVTAGIQAALGTASDARQVSAQVLQAAERMDEQTRRVQEQVARFVFDIQDLGLHPEAPAAAETGSALRAAG